MGSENSGLTLDRDLLHDAMNMCTATKLYALTKVFKRPVRLGAIAIENIGEVKLPFNFVELLDLKYKLLLEKNKQNGPVFTDQLYRIDEEPFRDALKEMATETVHEMFNSNEYIYSVDAVVDKFVICSGTEVYRGKINSEKRPGTFGTMLIQIPVKGANGGSHVDVTYAKERIRMELEVDCRTCYYVTAIAGKIIGDDLPQEFTITPANNWPCAILVADLIWEESTKYWPQLDADRLPQLIEMTYHSDRALSSWRYIANDFTAEQIKEDVLRNFSQKGHYFIESLFDEKLPLLDAAQTNALIIPLRENYCIENFNKASLVGDDALIVRALFALGYVNFELVLIQKTGVTDWRKSGLDETEEPIKVYKPYSHEDLQLLPVTVSVGRNLAGNLNGGIKCSYFGEETCNSCTHRAKRSRHFYAAFLVRPSHLPADDSELVLYSYSFLIDRSTNVEKSTVTNLETSPSPVGEKRKMSEEDASQASSSQQKQETPIKKKRRVKVVNETVGEQNRNETLWAVPLAEVPQNKALENFLRSEKQSQKIGESFCNAKAAERYGRQLIHSSPSPISVSVTKYGGKFTCEVTKKRKSPNGDQTEEARTSSDEVKESWRYEDAYVPSNRPLERFLKSDDQSTLLPKNKPIHAEVYARNYASALARITPINVAVGLREVDGGFYCELVKMRKYQRHSRKGLSCSTDCKCYKEVQIRVSPLAKRRLIF